MGAEFYRLTAERAVVNRPPMPDDAQLYELATRVGRRLLAAKRRMVSAESCTGGWIAKVMTDVPGSSAWFDCGFVTYSNAAKMRDLGVSSATLEAHGAVSEQTVLEMARGALRVSGADIAVSVSGIAGPDGGVPGKPVGTVWFATALRRGDDVVVDARRQLFERDREAIRRRSVEYALELILQLALAHPPAPANPRGPPHH
jgi:nicotinamide-nucleotide amidase